MCLETGDIDRTCGEKSNIVGDGTDVVFAPDAEQVFVSGSAGASVAPHGHEACVGFGADPITPSDRGTK